MKKSFFIALLLALALFPIQNSEARVEEENPVMDSSVPSAELSLENLREEGSLIENPHEVPVVEDGTRIPTSFCEIPSDQIESIQFYADHCLNRREDYDIDLNLRCTIEGPVYRSYCNMESALCFGSIMSESGVSIPICNVVPESASVCLRRHSCPVPRRATTPGATETSVATLSAISPTTVVEASAAFTLTVTGNNFTSSSQVLWNGRVKTTSYVSATELHAQIDAADIAHAATVPVTVLTGTYVSNSVSFTISGATVTRRDEGGTPPPPPSGPRTSPETVINLPGTTPPAGSVDGGCVLGAGSSSSMNFALVAFSFVTGTFFYLRKKK